MSKRSYQPSLLGSFWKSRAPSWVGGLAGWSVARLRLATTVGIWYHSDYSAPGIASSARLPDVDLERGRRIVDALEQMGLLWERDVRKGAPIPLDALLAVHSLSYLESVTEADKLAQVFGLLANDVDVDTILKSQRRASGGTMEAARWASGKKGRIAFNLGGGYHHAEPEMGSGFCVYNDVAASIQRVRSDGFSAPIVIVDLDFHQGNGNSVAFANDSSVLNFSIHGATWTHIDTPGDIQIRLPAGCDDDRYLGTLREKLRDTLERHRAGLLFFIAGTDILDGDALGDFRISPDGVFERDRFVLETAEELGLSTVVTLAGGYSRNAWKSSARMLRWALTGNPGALPGDEAGGLRGRFGRIASSLDPFELQFNQDDLGLTEADLMGELEGPPKATRLLGYYSVHGVELAFERYGFFDALRSRGFEDIRIEVDPSDKENQKISIYGRKPPGPHHRLVELHIARRWLKAPASLEAEEDLDMLSIEWLLLQDPTREFSLKYPQLPGQSHPGLGLLRELMEMLYQACLRLDLDGLVMHPSRFHISAVAAGKCLFIDPKVQGRFDALQESLRTDSIAEASRLVEDEKILRNDGQVFAWQPEDFIAPVSERLLGYFASKNYRQMREKAHEGALREGILEK